jgi:hypothetical protein
MMLTQDPISDRAWDVLCLSLDQVVDKPFVTLLKMLAI